MTRENKNRIEQKIAKVAKDFAREGARLRALGDGTENVEQLEAIERDLEALVGRARALAARASCADGASVTLDPTAARAERRALPGGSK